MLTNLNCKHGTVNLLGLLLIFSVYFFKDFGVVCMFCIALSAIAGSS